MGRPRVLIVEDELITANDIKETLEGDGYEVMNIARTGEKAIIISRKKMPDIVIMDVQLAGEITGIEAAHEILRIAKIPILFLTANDDPNTLDEVKKINSGGFLTKPLRISDFTTNVSIALNNFKSETEMKGENVNHQAIYIPLKNGHQKIENKDIFYIEASGSYINIYTKEKPIVLSTNLGNFQKQLTGINFIRVSRKHIINLDHIERIENNIVVVDKKVIPVGESYRHELFKHLKIIKTK
jgi:DNA-binding LytR/AlgR family response regulator